MEPVRLTEIPDDVISVLPRPENSTEKVLKLSDVPDTGIPGINYTEQQRQEKRGVLDRVKYFLGEGVIKPVAQGVELVPAGVESVVQAGLNFVKGIAQDQLAADGVVFGAPDEQYYSRTPEQQRRISLNNKIISGMDQAIESSKRLQQNWLEMTQTGKEAFDPNFLKASPIPTKENFSMARMLALGFQSVPLLGLAATVTAATKSPTAGAAVIGVMQASEEYNLALESKATKETANSMFIANALMLSVLESVPLTSFMKGGKLPVKMFRTAVQEGGEEVLQQLWVNSVAQIGYDDTRKLTEGMAENFIGGFISGGVIGSFGPNDNYQALLAKAKDAGVDVEKMQETVGTQIIENADNITQAFLEKQSPEAVIGQEGFNPSRTLAASIKQKGFDPVQLTVEEALKPLPQVELSEEEIGQLRVKQRQGGDVIDISKAIPDRKVIEEIKSSKEFQEADKDKQMELMIKGRTADLDVQRIAIEKRMTSLERDLSKTSNSADKKVKKLRQTKSQELLGLSKQLLSIHAQISDVVDSSAEELIREKVLLPGQSLESLRKQARNTGAQIERERVVTVFRNAKAQAAERRVALVKYLQARLPGSENAQLREKYNLRSAKDLTEAKLQKYFAEIEELRDSVRGKQLRKQAQGIIEKMSPQIVEGVKKGRFSNSNIQAMADSVIQVAELSASEVDVKLQEVHDNIVERLQNGEEGTEKLDDLRYEAQLLSTVGGLEQRNTDQLEDSIRFLSQKLAEFRMGRDIVKELRKAQWRVEEAQAVANIMSSEWKPENVFLKGVKVIGNQFNKLYHFSSFNLESFWRSFGLDKMVADPLFKVSEYNAALQQKMDEPIRKAALEVYGIPENDTRAYMQFLVDRLTVEPTEDPNLKPFVQQVVLHTGETKDFKLSRWKVMYWYAVAHQGIDVQDPSAYEILTNENELEAIREQATLDLGGTATQEQLDNFIGEKAAKIKGNAIPSEVLDRMFSDLTDKDKLFAIRLREAFTSFWPLINPVYARATGVNLTRVDSYIPWIRKTRSVKVVEDMFTHYAMIEGHVTPFPGSVKERRSVSTAPFDEISLMDVYMGFRDTMSHWLATHDITVRQQKYLKNAAIREAIVAVSGETTPALMDFHLKGMASRGRTDQVIRIPFMDMLRRNISRYYLAKPKQFLLQMTSSAVAIQDIGFINFVKGASSFFRDPRGANELLSKALSMHNRYQNITMEMKEVQDLIKLEKTRVVDKLSTFDKFAFTFVKAGNKGGVLIGGWAIFKETYDKTNDLQKAYEAFDKYVLSTQQSALREQQSAATVGYARYFFQFVSAVGQYGRIYQRSWSNLVKNPNSENITQWARTMVIFHGIIPVMRWMVAQVFLPVPQEEEDKEKRLNQLTAYAISGPFSGLWLLGDMANFATHLVTGQAGFDTGPAVISQMNRTRKTLGYAIRKAIDEDSDPDKALDYLLKAGKETGGLFMGVPSQISDVVRELFRMSAGTNEGNPLEEFLGIMYGQSIDMIDYSRGRR